MLWSKSSKSFMASVFCVSTRPCVPQLRYLLSQPDNVCYVHLSRASVQPKHRQTCWALDFDTTHIQTHSILRLTFSEHRRYALCESEDFSSIQKIEIWRTWMISLANNVSSYILSGSRASSEITVSFSLQEDFHHAVSEWSQGSSQGHTGKP